MPSFSISFASSSKEELDLIQRKITAWDAASVEMLNQALFADDTPPKPPTLKQRITARINRARNKLALWIGTDDLLEG